MTVHVTFLSNERYGKCFLLKSSEDASDVAVVSQQEGGHVHYTCLCGPWDCSTPSRVYELLDDQFGDLRKWRGSKWEAKTGGEINRLLEDIKKSRELRDEAAARVARHPWSHCLRSKDGIQHPRQFRERLDGVPAEYQKAVVGDWLLRYEALVAEFERLIRADLGEAARADPLRLEELSSK